MAKKTSKKAKQIEFKAEIKQVLDILIHSLYSEQEIFLRELVSNASDALNRFKVESLKSGNNVLDPSAELGVWIVADKEANTLTIRDTGIGMSQEDMTTYLGTIAHSGAKNFIEAMKSLNKGDTKSTTDVIGQFGVGFYSVFMVADEVTVTSRSFEPEAVASYWKSSGEGSYEVGEAEKAERGTTIEIKLKEDAKEYAETYRIRQIIKEHSDFVAFPIYLEEESYAEETKGEKVFNQVNAQTALWRERPADVDDDKYKSFYQQLTFDFQEPTKTIHFQAEMPIQFYALLFIPSRRDYKMFQKQDEYGLKLYARKVLISENFKELLPPYLRFIEGVVDSEDLPLNVSREMVQNTPMVARIKKALVGRISTELERLAKDDEVYKKFYSEFSVFLKEGIASDAGSTEKFVDLLRFSSSATEADNMTSLNDYLGRMKEDQKDIYYVLGDSKAVVSRSSHLDYFKKNDLEVLFFTDPIDSFMIMGLNEYQGKQLKSIDDAELELPEEENKIETPKDEGVIALIAYIKQTLGDRVEDVRESKVLTDSAARLLSPAGAGNSGYVRAQRLMGQDFEVPKRILELNPKSDVIKDLAARYTANKEDALLPIFVEQLFENELLAEGIHPNPADMIPRLQQLMSQALKNA